MCCRRVDVKVFASRALELCECAAGVQTGGMDLRSYGAVEACCRGRDMEVWRSGRALQV